MRWSNVKINSDLHTLRDKFQDLSVFSLLHQLNTQYRYALHNDVRSTTNRINDGGLKRYYNIL